MTVHGRQVALAAGALLPLYGARRYFRNWGTTKQECRMYLPGDELMRQPVRQSTEGVWIEQREGHAVGDSPARAVRAGRLAARIEKEADR